ncbi:MAG: tagatose 1,6-diphosphate aldolase [Alcaligenaceae bacterium]
MAKISPGKLWGMRRLADHGGRWKMIAIDQRGPLMQPIAQKRGVEQAAWSDLALVKSSVTEHLSPHASAMLLDPDYAYFSSVGKMSPSIGLCLSLEHHITTDLGQGRLSRTIPDWSVEKIRRIGGDAVKLLIWYRPDADAKVCEHQQALVKKIGQECKDHDIVLLLELLVYPLASDTPGFLEANRTKLVIESMRDFASPEFLVDIYKLEPPAAILNVPKPDSSQATAWQKHFDDLSQHITRPWVLLSAGAGPEDFMQSLTYAYRAGASGYLCGRAIWHAAFERFPNIAAFEQDLKTESCRYVQELNALTDRLATPWSEKWGTSATIEMTGQGPEFSKHYVVS